jgi:hypothetical protein
MNLHTDICILAIICIPSDSVEVYFSPLPHQHLFFTFIMIAILTGMRWSFTVVWICISFMAMDVEHFLIYLSAICTSEHMCSIQFPIYKYDFLFFMCLVLELSVHSGY